MPQREEVAVGRVDGPAIKCAGSWQASAVKLSTNGSKDGQPRPQRVKSSNQATKVPSPGPFSFPPPASTGGHVQDKQIRTPDSVEVIIRKIKARPNKLKKGKDRVL